MTKKQYTVVAAVLLTVGCAAGTTFILQPYVDPSVEHWLRMTYRADFVDPLPETLRPKSGMEDNCFFAGWLINTAHAAIVTAALEGKLNASSPGAAVLARASREAMKFYEQFCRGPGSPETKEYGAILYMVGRSGTGVAREQAVFAKRAYALSDEINMELDHQQVTLQMRLRASMSVNGPPLSAAVGAADLTFNERAVAAAMILAGPAVASVNWSFFLYTLFPEGVITGAAAATAGGH